MAELAYLGGKKAEKYDKRIALDLYGASVLHAYQYLFDDRFAATRNPYDPQYRGACDLYNGALEAGLRIDRARTRNSCPDTTKTINTAAGAWDINCELRGSALAAGGFRALRVRLRLRGQGAEEPLPDARAGRAADRRARTSYQGEPAAAKYYPPGLSFPVTAFLRPLSKIDPQTGQIAARNQGVLELYDPLATDETMVGRPAGAAGERSDHAAGLLPLASRR